MVSESSDVHVFFSAHSLFQNFSEADLDFVCSHINVGFNKVGDTLYRQDDTDSWQESGLLLVRSGSLEIRSHDGLLLDRLSAGDFLIPGILFGKGEVANKLAAAVEGLQVTVLEDCLYYELAEFAFQSLISRRPELSALCDTYARLFHYKPEIAAVRAVDAGQGTEHYFEQYVRDYMANEVIAATSSTSIREAAQLMKEKNISSLLVIDEGQLQGIVTDRDFRTRVLAEGVADSEPLSQVMTRKPHCVNASARLHDAQMKMMAEGIHHLPVLREKMPVGIITVSDIMRATNVEPLSLVRGIDAAKSVAGLARVARLLPDLVAKLIERDTRAVEIGEIITTVTDGLTRRLLVLGEKQLGPAPCAYAWLAFGSQARQEQMLGSDQDNGLILEDGASTEALEYFRQLAEFVNLGLNDCGIVLCPGEIMARNDKWRMPLAGWRQCFQNWIERPSTKALMHASIFFDMRHIAGDTDLSESLHASILAWAGKNTIFQALMCDNALQHSPPLGFFKTFVLESDGDHVHTLDLKKRGTIPIVDVGRNYSLANGLSDLNTVGRLQALGERGALSKDLAESLVDAHEFIAGIRLEAQGKEYRAGQKVDNYVDPKSLSPLVRHQLKDAFRMVREAQTAMRSRFSSVL